MKQVSATPTHFTIRFDYDQTLVELVKEQLPGRRWDNALKLWTVPLNLASSQKLWEVLGSRGFEFTLEAAEANKRLKGNLEASHAKSADIQVPCPAGEAYLPFQLAAIAFALDKPHVLFGDEMGCGKGIEAIGVINALPDIKRVLVICPATAKINWSRELTKWLVRPMSVGIVTGSDWVDVDCPIINYDILARHEYVIREKQWDLLIIDEAAYLKSGHAQRTHQVLGKWAKAEDERLARIPSRKTLMLTGTPLLNRPIELWPLVKDANLFRNWEQYVTRYCDGHKERAGRREVWNVQGASNLEELQTVLRSSWMIRRLKSEVMTELPPKRRQVIELPANGNAGVVKAETQAVAAEMDKLADLRLAVEKAKVSESQDEYDEAVQKLRHGVMVALQLVSKVRHETAVAKVPMAIEFIKDAMEAGEKLVVFGWHHDVLGAIHDSFPGSVLVTGETSMKKRQQAIDSFQEDPQVRMFIGSIGAAGTAITLTAASHVIFVELEWVPGNMSQAEDRTHRKGQHNAVLVQHLVLEGSMDATMARTLISKQAVLDATMDDPIALGAIPVLPVEGEPETANVSRQRITAESLGLTEAEVTEIHGQLRYLAGLCDGANARDGEGYNKCDSSFGKWLAAADRLSPKMAAAAKRMLVKYKGQLGK
jgi:SWI/SNF-related matrix-associated actin-dependent regulator 1 of chromatin subfamily A